MKTGRAAASLRQVAQLFILYADRKLMTPATIAFIKTQYQLQTDRTEMHVSRWMQTNATT